MKHQPKQSRLYRRTVLAAVVLGAASRRAMAQAPAVEDPWPSLAAQIFTGRPLQDGTAIVAIDAPYRAEDAALVPITLHNLLPADDKRQIRNMTLVIDQNPSPLAAVFSPGPTSGLRSLSTRVRVDSYTNLHAVAELSDGQLYASARFVKAAGGCSAPNGKNAVPASLLGKMKFKFEEETIRYNEPVLVQLMIRHPNESPLAGDFDPSKTPQFVRSVTVTYAGKPVMSAEVDFSISDNPSFRFYFVPYEKGELRVEVEDTLDQRYTQTFTVADDVKLPGE